MRGGMRGQGGMQLTGGGGGGTPAPETQTLGPDSGPKTSMVLLHQRQVKATHPRNLTRMSMFYQEAADIEEALELPHEQR